MPISLPCNLKMSTPAYTSLRDHAATYGFVQGTLTAKGVGHFLDALTTTTFQDTRPIDVRDAATGVRIKKSTTLTTQVNIAWIWSLEYPRQRYRISLLPTSIEFYINLANAFTIAPYLSTLSRLSAVFEAIGIAWLTPFVWPSKQRQRYRVPTELDF